MCVCLLAEHAKANEEKFKKMKEIYNKLREEHVALIRKVNVIYTVYVVSAASDAGNLDCTTLNIFLNLKLEHFCQDTMIHEPA